MKTTYSTTLLFFTSSTFQQPATHKQRVPTMQSTPQYYTSSVIQHVLSFKADVNTLLEASYVRIIVKLNICRYY